MFSAVEAGSGRSAGVQAGYQILALLVTIGMGVVGGIITGKCQCKMFQPCLFSTQRQVN